MATGQFASVNDVLTSFQSKPFGMEAGDPTSGQVLNRTEMSEYVKCFVRNWSANKEREYVEEAISWRLGGKRAALLSKADPESDFDLNAARAEAYNGQDPSIKNTGIKAQTAILTFDNKRFEIPPSKDGKKEPEWFPIPQGVMDLYYGNVDRLESTDIRERNLELEAVRNRRRDFCIRKGRNGQNQNDAGYLEFKREVILPQAMAVDVDSVYGDEYVEV